MRPRFLPLSSQAAWALRTGLDAHGRPAECAGPSTGASTPCRHCLRQVPAGRSFLIAAHRPFAGLNPYTETGPIFLCADHCQPGGPDIPTSILTASEYILRGYSADERIVAGSGAVVPTAAIEARCTELLSKAEIAFVHIRSASNNCFLCRVTRG